MMTVFSIIGIATVWIIVGFSMNRALAAIVINTTPDHRDDWDIVTVACSIILWPITFLFVIVGLLISLLDFIDTHPFPKIRK